MSIDGPTLASVDDRLVGLPEALPDLDNYWSLVVRDVSDSGVVISGPVNGWGYRPHLDGLRAVAVYLVVLFHSGSFRFGGGFVGVDLFFVLSGFLVTNVLLSDASTGTIQFARFYARRARRLIPAASVAIVGVAITALMVSTRLDRVNLIPDARAASLWYANWHFIASSNDYFAADDLESPLLHFWSLAIEEQFYLLFPLVLFGAIRFGRGQLRWVTGVLGAILVASLAAQLWWAQVDVNHAYLGTDARIYQPLAGVVLATVLWQKRLPERGRRVGDVVLGGSIVALVVLAMVAPGLATSWRGMLATVVAVGAIVGAELSPSGWVAAALSWKPIRYLGAISYGTYLWHWPVVVFGRRVLEIAPDAMFVISAVLGTALAALSFEMLEQPIRSATWARNHSKASIAIGVTTAVIVGLVVSPFVLNQSARARVRPIASKSTVQAQGQTPVPDLDWAEIKDDRSHNEPCASAETSKCVLRQGSGRTVYLMGDSHADVWSATVLALADTHDWTVYFSYSQGCPWVKGLYLTDNGRTDSEDCVDLRPLTYEQIEAVDPDLVILAERGTDPRRARRLETYDDAYDGLTDEPELLERAMIDSIDVLESPGRGLLLVEPIPTVSENPLDCLSGAEFVEQCTFPANAEAYEDEIYRAIAATNPAVLSLDLDGVLCAEGCPAMIDGMVVRRDKDHLTSTFAAALAENFDRAIQQLDEEISAD